MDRKTKINVWYILAALAGFMLIQAYYQASKQYTTIPYSRFEQLLDENKIDRVWIAQNSIEGVLKQKEKDGLKRFIATRVNPTWQPNLTNITSLISAKPRTPY